MVPMGMAGLYKTQDVEVQKLDFSVIRLLFQGL
jgi:hypothetical protein